MSLPETHVSLDEGAAEKAAALPRVHPNLHYYMLFVAVAGNAIFYIQGAKILINESAKDVSPWAFGCSFWAVASWFVYGLATKDKVIVIANIIAMIGAAFVLVGCWLYG